MTSYAGPGAAPVLREPDCAPPAQPTTGVWFRRLYQSHFTEVIRLVLRFGICQDDAEDLAQRVFLVMYRRRDEVEAFARPGAWLRGVTLRIVREYFRWWKVRNAARWLIEYNRLWRDEDDFSPERNAATGESLDRISDVLQQMSGKLREAMVLLDLEGLTPREAAELLGVPHNTLRSRRALAREEFKRLWEQQQGDRSHE